MGKPWEYFIVSFFDSEYKKAIAYLGSHSGRNENKIENAGLTAVAIGKTMGFKEAKQTMLEALKKDLAERLDDSDAKNSRVMIAQYDALDFANEFAAELEPVFGKVDIVNLSLSVATHIGPGTVAVAAARKSSNN